MIDVEEIKILNGIDCECGKHEFTLKDLKRLEQLTDTHGFYGNIVKYYSETICPECGRNVILLLKQRGQTWEIMNTAVRNQVSESDVTVVVSDEEKETSNKVCCPVCQQGFKSKAGLSSHMKIHEN